LHATPLQTSHAVAKTQKQLALLYSSDAHPAWATWCDDELQQSVCVIGFGSCKHAAGIKTCLEALSSQMPNIGSIQLLIRGVLQNGRDGIGDVLVGPALEQSYHR